LAPREAGSDALLPAVSGATPDTARETRALPDRDRVAVRLIRVKDNGRREGEKKS
jgi:hypothetical protein